MNRTSHLFGTVLALLFFAGADVRAEPISWTYQGSGTAVVNADHPGTGGVSLTYDPTTDARGDSYVPVANLWTFSTADQGHPDTFNSANYEVSLLLTDKASGQSGTVTFPGQLNGTLSSGHSLVNSTFPGLVSKALTLGSNLYKVTLNGFVPPGPPTASNSGSIGALVTLNPASVPEPSTLLLASLGLAGAGLAAWRKRRASR